MVANSRQPQQQQATNTSREVSTKSGTSKPSDRLYKVLLKAQDCTKADALAFWYAKALKGLQVEDDSICMYRNPRKKDTCLHLAAKLMDIDCSKQLLQIFEHLCHAFPQALCMTDIHGNIPLHYAIAPSRANTVSDNAIPLFSWSARGVLVSKLIQTDPVTSESYLKRNNVIFDCKDATGGCSPLYRVLQTLGDDTNSTGPSVDYIQMLHETTNIPEMPGIGNASDGDKPLSLLYRKFTRQFDTSEKFFTGDNSRPEVVEHRQRYKMAAGNTWKIIEVLYKPPSRQDQPFGIVHRAVQVETPPDLLRYIVETNAQDLARKDGNGNLPLHYAAKSTPPQHVNPNTHFPVFYNKYVVDELLYKFPEGASIQDANGAFPLTLAVTANKQWIGGGIKSLHDAFPHAMTQINLDNHESLQRALSLVQGEDMEEDGGRHDKEMSPSGIIKDQQHDAIMLVQQPDVDVTEVVTSMWAHEEDAGVQMLGCVAIYKMLVKSQGVEVLQIALSAVAAVVNAMKAHPNEMIVQETACKALRYLAPADGKREVSMVASGAVAAIVGAMQAHVGDGGVQREGCSAIAAIVKEGGAERATVVASVSGLTAILNALSAHPDTVSIQMAGLKALVSLTDHGEEANLPELPRSHTEPILLAAQKAFPRECGKMAGILEHRMSA